MSNPFEEAKDQFNAKLWGGEQVRENYTPAWYLRPVRLLLLTVDGYLENDLPLHASGLTYNTILALVPFMALLFSLFNSLGLPPAVRDYLVNQISAGSPDIAAALTRFVGGATSAAMGTVGMVTWLVTGFFVLNRVRTSLDLIFDIHLKGNMGRRFMEFLALMVIVPALLVATFAFSSFVRTLHLYAAEYNMPFLEKVGKPLADVSGITIYWVLLYYAYAFLPEIKVGRRHALLGAVVGGVLLTLAQNFYIVFMLKVTAYQAIYGAMALLPLMLVWVYTAWLIFLYGAQLACTSEHFSLFLGRQFKHSEALGQALPVMSIGLVAGLDRLWRQTNSPVHDRTLFKALNIPASVGDDLLRRMVRSQVITPVVQRPDHYVPNTPLDQLTVAEFLAAMDLLPRLAAPVRYGSEHLPPDLTELLGRGDTDLGKALDSVFISEIGAKIK